uniref:non-specific lipid-transfer protein 1-like n=1 Tax=Erigeron canadensis TaxID=72917 RepID=UPI001CB962DC|nr:non-specific lipid-transfer protein 1-like [Erigeron canadensis]
MASKFMKLSLAVALVVVLMTLAAPEVEGVTCGEVVRAGAPCLGYLRNGGAPSSACCSGIRDLKNKARSTANRKTICSCLKSASSSYRGISGNYASSLPSKCSINFPYKLSPSTDCNRIQ